jgi:hypothetical protein
LFSEDVDVTAGLLPQPYKLKENIKSEIIIPKNFFFMIIALLFTMI